MTEDQEMLAAEYVLGTLDADERAQAQALVETDARFAASVRGWERRLGELQAMVDPVEPPSHVWDRIKAGTLGLAPEEPMRLPEVRSARRREPVKFSFAARNLAFWRGATAAAGALAAVLALFIGLREFDVLPSAAPPRPVETAQGPQPPTQPAAPAGRFVAVLQRDATAPAFLLTVDVDSRSLTVRRVAATPEPGRSYELWLVSDRFPQPRSLGVVGEEEYTVRPALAAYDPDTISRAAYAVSLEPQGGSPTGVPTGPVLFVGELIEASPR
jgi:anti-sigma-K factor RskA